MQVDTNPEVAQTIRTSGFETNYHDVGEGDGIPVLLLHGSGAGVSAWANWRGLIPVLAEQRRVIAPDLVGFGYTTLPDPVRFEIFDTWIDQILALLDGLEIPKVHVVGNSFGGGLALHLAVRHPQRLGRIVLMGAGGVQFDFTPELDALWGYTPSVENMKKIMDIMAYDRSLVTDELAELRYRATARPGAQEAFEQVFPEPRQRWLDAQIVPDEDLAAIEHEVLILHGREDRVVPVAASQKMFDLIPNSQLHIFGKCGHWTQIEHAARFQQLVSAFFAEDSAEANEG
ncbi:alpha/beta fold hydrolase [Rhodococcus rhodochrous]|uniref:alpha/beta fold hydrolase n=1 Tax=Rhodococcus rhodochrous TaxID=1829 RepID=UPI001E2B1420|nr:alpha/beta fold hydrolase [Rhodococcus rhodochrous]MCD2100081.1 alpha/beta fold hydrolase [Rhodococcus rhodochrous]MCD2124463.1 alpha/beta fold hydrolase [Rhodococcus rhodochrous]MCQ4137370.1 alpha/beta fold hydrolase [Rhodococcus rhodochrous]MDJ0021218.1 alpha/beta fold hydrolase [Rhodococcus rhodochrous]